MNNVISVEIETLKRILDIALENGGDIVEIRGILCEIIPLM